MLRLGIPESQQSPNHCQIDSQHNATRSSFAALFYAFHLLPKTGPTSSTLGRIRSLWIHLINSLNSSTKGGNTAPYTYPKVPRPSLQSHYLPLSPSANRVRDSSIRKEPTGGIQKHGKSLAGAIREEPSRRDTETRIQVHGNRFTGTGSRKQFTGTEKAY